MKLKDSEISLLLLDVLRGYSKVYHKGEPFFLRHFLVYDELNLAEYELDSFNSAVRAGIKKEEELLDNAIKRGFWTKKEDDEIKNLKWVLTKSEKAIEKVSDYNVRKSLKQEIERDQTKLKELENRKHSIVAHSAESLAIRKRNSKTLSANIFKDQSLKNKVEEDDLFYLMPAVNDRIELIADVDNMLRMAYMPSFFDLYSISSENPLDIIGKNLFDISIWQKNLIFYASVLLNKLKKMDMPDDVREDPVKIYKYKPQEESNTNDDVVYGVDDLRAKMSKNNGKLTAQDF